ncbi:MAG: hypothetical protein VX938_13300, partial [Myxococcota bacterium]|nr:hypothetical protein [Myxococcota bacterium]
MRLTLFAALIWIPTAFPAPVRADGPVLHEPLPPVPAGRQRASVVLYDEQRGDDSLPEAIEVNGDVLQRPQFLSAAQRAEITRDGRFRTATDARPDLQTEREEQLNYRTIFQPSVLPFKRGMALSEIQADGTINAPGEPLTEVPVVGNVPSRGRDMFWADLELDLEKGVPV